MAPQLQLMCLQCLCLLVARTRIVRCADVLRVTYYDYSIMIMHMHSTICIDEWARNKANLNTSPTKIPHRYILPKYHIHLIIYVSKHFLREYLKFDYLQNCQTAEVKIQKLMSRITWKLEMIIINELYKIQILYTNNI